VVELTLVNRGKLNHTFTAPDLNIEFQMPAGATSKETFVASKPGEYRFFSAPLSEFEVMKGIVIVK
jgi:heme/copper-type cytochrome/quinol oxidase subunit 2